jgi:hypothetical protein
MGSIVVGGRRARYERLRFDRASICNNLSSIIEKAASPVMRMSGFFLFKLWTLLREKVSKVIESYIVK